MQGGVVCSMPWGIGAGMGWGWGGMGWSSVSWFPQILSPSTTINCDISSLSGSERA